MTSCITECFCTFENKHPRVTTGLIVVTATGSLGCFLMCFSRFRAFVRCPESYFVNRKLIYLIGGTSGVSGTVCVILVVNKTWGQPRSVREYRSEKKDPPPLSTDDKVPIPLSSGNSQKRVIKPTNSMDSVSNARIKRLAKSF